MKLRNKLILVLLTLFLIPLTVNAESNTGSLSPGPSGGGSGSGGGGCSVSLGTFGYRITLVKGQSSYERFPGTRSVDYWSNYYGSTATEWGGKCIKAVGTGTAMLETDYTNMGYEIYYSKNLCSKQELANGNSCGFKKYDYDNFKACPDKMASNGNYKLGGNSDAQYDVLGVGNGNFNTSKYGNSPGATSSGNYFAKKAMDKLDDILSIGDINKMSSSQLNIINALLVNANYKKGTTAKENINKALSDKIIIQLEPTQAVYVNSSCGSYSHKAYAGSMAELYNGPFSKMDTWGLYHTTYGHAIIYAGASENHKSNSTWGGIKIGNPDVEQANIQSKGTNTSSFGVSLFYLPDFLKNQCTEDLQKALAKTSETAYNNAINGIKSSTYFADECGRDGSNCPFLKYSYSEIKMMGYTSESSVSCQTEIPCSNMASRIYTNTTKTNENTWNLKSAYSPFKVTGDTTEYTTYKDALKKSAFTKSGAATTNYNYSVWNQYAILATGSTPRTCEKLICNSTTVKSVYNKYKNGTISSTVYNNYINNLYNSEGGKYGSLLESIWGPDGLNQDGPDCIEMPNCPQPEPTVSCNSSIVFQDYMYGRTSGKTGSNSDASKCWVSGFGFTSPGIKGSAVTVESDCNLFCSEKVVFTLPGSNTEKTKAGQVFKWGVTEDKTDKLFGTMTVYKYCTANSSKNTNCTNKSFSYSPSSFAPLIRTTFKINYKEPIAAQTGEKNYDLTDIPLELEQGTSSGSLSYTCANENCSRIKSGRTTAVTPNIEMSVSFNINYTNGLKWSSSKNDNSLYSNVTDTNYYYPIGYGLPTSFTVPTGENYGNGTGRAKMEVEIDNIGTNNRFSKMGEKLAPTSSTAVSYKCNYNIYNELFDDECKYDASGNLTRESPSYCDTKNDDPVVNNTKTKEIDVVFRTVHLMADSSSEQLSRAFPGRSGSGDRKIGSNWVYKEGTSGNKNSLSDIYNILNANVYRKRPMYEIRLTVSTIQDIRRLNNNAKLQGKDPYSELEKTTGNDSNGQIGYVCVSSGDYSFCASNFLSHLTSISNPIGGRCIDISETRARANSIMTEIANPTAHNSCI